MRICRWRKRNARIALHRLHLSVFFEILAVGAGHRNMLMVVVCCLSAALNTRGLGANSSHATFVPMKRGIQHPTEHSHVTMATST